ncbi:zinc finger protein 888-like [Periplaneta americana]|uniref:zinc finger protein 888-like n=1 Tax=Periplaneta americana TaxID=6978 RepID=UPI0037E78CFE
MEACNGSQTPSGTGAAVTITSTTTTTTTTTAISVSNGGAHGGEDEDSNLDRLTQMLPECFVSVKLESNEDTETSGNMETAVPVSRSNRLEMQVSPQNSMGTAVVAAAGSRIAPCFHHRGTGSCTTIPDLPPWLQHCYTTGQMSAGEGAQQGPQHFQSAAYLAQEGDRSLKSSGGVTRLDTAPPAAGIGGLANGDICDSNTFLNYVLNQQRSSGIFLFDPMRSLHPESSTETVVQHEPVHKHGSDVLKHSTPPSSIPPVEGNPTRRDAATNTVWKYSLPLHADAKTNTDESDMHHCTKCHENGKLAVAPGDSAANGSRRLHYVDVDRPFTCEICLKNYPTSTALMNHMRYHRGQRPYQCEVCNKAFATNSHLVTHRRVHTGERPFQCRLCRRSFADRSAYVKHERTHGPNGTIIKRYKCEECGNAFVDSCGLKKHVRIHTGERPYCCSVCQKTFSTSSTFVAHKRIHSGERPYKCDNCDKMFITKSHLLTHRRTHTGEKPFTCQVCNRAFADGSSFRRHERLHTGENRHTCDVCGKGFPFDTSLAKHKQSHIPGTPTYVYMV